MTGSEWTFALVGVVAGGIAVFWWLRRQQANDEPVTEPSGTPREDLLDMALWGSRAEGWQLDLHTGVVDRIQSKLSTAGVLAGDARTFEDLFQYVHPDDVAMIRSAVDAHLRGITKCFEVSYRFAGPGQDQDYVWVTSRGQIVERDESGEPLRMAGSNQVVSRLMQTEAELRRRNRQLQVALWAGNNVLWQANLADRAMTFVGHPGSSELLGDMDMASIDDFLDRVHEDDRAEVEAQMRHYLDGHSNRYEATFRTNREDGHQIWLLSRGRVVEHSEDGVPMMIAGAVQDVTPLKQAERDLRTANENLRLAVRGGGNHLWHVDLSTGAVTRLIGPDIGSTEAMNFRSLDDVAELMEPAELAPIRERYLDHIKGILPVFEASFGVRVDGKRRMLLVQGQVVQRDHEGEALVMAGTTQDITRLYEAEEALRELNESLEGQVDQRTGELRAANASLRETLSQLRTTQTQLIESEKMAALGNLVAGVAHEVNTPLGVALTAASHLQRQCEKLAAEQVPSEQAVKQVSKSASFIENNLRRAADLVRSFKQVAVDQSSQERRKFELRSYIEEILVSLHPNLRRHAQRIEVECPSDTVVDSYPGALYQILANLLVNSINHGFAGGAQGTISLVVTVQDGQVELVYTDDGRGMDEGLVARVFEPFFTTRRGQGGSGLGMHITYNLATKILGGSIDCWSKEGQGVRFTLRFPVIAPTDEAAQRVASSA